MKSVIALVALLFALSVSPNAVSAQGRGKGQAHKPTPASTQGSPKADKIKPVKIQTPEAAKAPKRPKTPKTEHAAKHAPVTPVTPVTATTPTTQSVKNPKLETRLLALLPPGTTIQDASQGFKNWGQFVAAVHVSNNLNIPFADLKTQMTGPTPVSLGQAIQTLKGTSTPTTTESGALTTTKIKKEVKKAEDAANADLRLSRERS
ncbi:MAG TPA: hypothetical protein VJM31_18820 [Vicinamibacterales bacterium]|nr:hypothetical protein [Vicinamibacterales bacterium]